MAAGMRVLDVFAASGGFGVYAAAGGATRVTSVDQSAPALAAADRNFAHNASLPNVRHCEHDSIVGDAYEVMDRLIQRRKHYDIVVVDPPSFAQRKSNVERALHAYGQLTQRAVQLTRPDGLLMQASCSSRITEQEFFATVRSSAQRAGFDLTEVRRTAHAAGSPGDVCPRRIPESAVRPGDPARLTPGRWRPRERSGQPLSLTPDHVAIRSAYACCAC